jgi:thiol-disulfide isomerase/thioredoxin
MNQQDIPVEGAGPARRSRVLLRRFIYPLVVVALIIGAIWYLEQRGDEARVAPTGERYGPAPMPEALVPPGEDVAASEGSLAPNFLLEALEGDDIRLSDYRGRPVIINFWATWCSPCRKEMPQFIEAQEKYADEGLVIIAVNMQEGRAIIQPFAEDFGMNFPIAIDRTGSVGDRYRLLGLPMTYFVDRDGVIQSVFTGPFEERDRDTEVRGAIEESDLEERIALILGDSDGESDGSG